MKLIEIILMKDVCKTNINIHVRLNHINPHICLYSFFCLIEKQRIKERIFSSLFLFLSFKLLQQ